MDIDLSLSQSQDIETLLQNLREGHYKSRIERNNFVFEAIKKLAPISVYALHKKTGLSYPTIKQLIKELEFCDLISVKVEIGQNDMPVKMIYCEEVKK